MKVMRFLLGLVIGAGVALLVAPKSGRELREQLVGAAGDRMLGAPPEAYPGPDVAASWDVDSDRSGAATAVAEPSVAVEPAAEKPLVEPPAAEEAPEEAPALEEPAVEPEPDEVVAVEPAVEPAEPLVAGPPVEEVPAEEPVAETPTAEEPTAEEPTAEEPAVEQPTAEQPTAEEAAVAEAPPRPFPVWEQHPEEPAGEDLRARIEETRETLEAELAEPFAQEAAEQEVVDEVAPAEVVAEEVEVLEEAGEAASEAPAAAESPVVQAQPEAPVVEEPAVVEEPVADETVTEEQALEAPVPTGEALPEASVAEAPGAETAVAEVAPEDSAAESPREGGVIDQAEMRRRIEETRARLKAKAFDAMMSGEAALLARDSGDKPVPKGDDHGLDAETDSVIDESLSQEEY